MHNAINKITSAFAFAVILSLSFAGVLEAAELVYIYETAPHHVPSMAQH